MQRVMPPLSRPKNENDSLYRFKLLGSHIEERVKTDQRSQNDPKSAKKLHQVPIGDDRHSTTSSYPNSACFNLPDTAKSSSSQSNINQRISSAKVLRIKQLQNQLTDAHFHLNELSNENKLLKAIQKRQDLALKRYEGTDAELPRLINSHHEDFRALQAQHKKLRAQYSETCSILKEKEKELMTLQKQNKKLVALSRDRHLGERDKLQMEVLDLKHRMNEQDEVIQNLRRKLESESKYLKHQLKIEIMKHKETQKQLLDSQTRQKNLERVVELNQKKSYQPRYALAGRMKQSVNSQSLSSLNERRSESHKNSIRKTKPESEFNQSLPALEMRSQAQESSKQSNSNLSFNNSGASNYSDLTQLQAHSLQSVGKRNSSSFTVNSYSNSPSRESQLESIDPAGDHREKCSKEAQGTDSLPEMFNKELKFPDCAKNEEKDRRDSYTQNFTDKSRSLYTRLVNSANDTHEDQVTRIIQSPSNGKPIHLERDIEETSYDRDSVITVIPRSSFLEYQNSLKYSYSSDCDNDLEIPLDCDPDKDARSFKQSDIIIDDLEDELSRTLSTIESHERADKFVEIEKKDIADRKILKNDHLGNETVDTFISSSISPKEQLRKESSDGLFHGQSAESSTSDSMEKEPKDIEVDQEVSYLSVAKNDSEIIDQTKPSLLSSTKSKKGDAKVNLDEKNIHENTKSFDKAKLLAAMKAIDDNENIEYVDQKAKGLLSRVQITENLYRGLPSHSKRKNIIMKELFDGVGSNQSNNSRENQI